MEQGTTSKLEEGPVFSFVENAATGKFTKQEKRPVVETKKVQNDVIVSSRAKGEFFQQFVYQVGHFSSLSSAQSSSKIIIKIFLCAQGLLAGN